MREGREKGWFSGEERKREREREKEKERERKREREREKEVLVVGLGSSFLALTTPMALMRKTPMDWETFCPKF